MRKVPAVVLAPLLVLAVALPVSARPQLRSDVRLPDAAVSKVRAGVGVADATWHVGAGAGQYAKKNPNAGDMVRGGEADPHGHSTAQQRSYGVQSRLTYRALVVEGSNGKRVALVKSDSYLAQDLLTRRVAQILAEKRSSITREQILLAASHNHSSPYYTTPAWGVWLFQDAFDLRAFEYHARQMAASILAAEANLVPARMGATEVEHTIYKGNIVGGALADDGTPAGYPDDHQDAGLVVVRFDDVSKPGAPAPLAVFVNHGQHPESLDAHDLITADFLAPLERFVERDLGAPLIFSQGDVGSAEGPYLRGREDRIAEADGEVVRAWAHVGHAQTERGARYLADSITAAWKEIGANQGRVRFSTDFPVEAVGAWIPGPVSHPYPSVSNCRSESTAEGNPGSPILGLPDCKRPGTNDPTNMLWENLKAHGLPVPDHYDAPGFTAVEENARLRLEVFRLGEVLLASCACEAQMDLILNLEARLNDIEGDWFNGYDWGARCSQTADTTWTCPNPRDLSKTVTVSADRYRRMRAQVNNPADGWDKPENALAANSEPSDPTKIWGNFSREELPAPLGFALPVGVGHASDYNGYTVSYREYMNRDHYRKALTSYGPHTADYINTRLVRMATALKGGPVYAGEPHDTALEADEARQEALAVALGKKSAAAYDTWVANLPNDKGPAEVLTQPGEVVRRFSAATFSWRGGSNAVDNPLVRVERAQPGRGWVAYADHSGEVQTMVAFPRGVQGTADTHAGNTEWRWTANFEVFDAFPRRVHPDGQTPDGVYRFVVDGHIRQDGKTLPYRLESAPFTVAPWEGIAVEDVRVEQNGDVSFVVPAIDYPRTYASPFAYVRDDGRVDVCKTCSFRPWASRGEVAEAFVTVTRADGSVARVQAALVDDRWVAPAELRDGDQATVARGDVVDGFGEINGEAVPAQ